MLASKTSKKVACIAFQGSRKAENQQLVLHRCFDKPGVGLVVRVTGLESEFEGCWLLN